MAYDISFDGGVDEAFETLDSEATAEDRSKLEKVANNQWRSPTDWDYSPWSGQSKGKFDWDSYRVFADINEEQNEIVVRDVRYRENLYR